MEDEQDPTLVERGGFQLVHSIYDEVFEMDEESMRAILDVLKKNIENAIACVQ